MEKTRSMPHSRSKSLNQQQTSSRVFVKDTYQPQQSSRLNNIFMSASKQKPIGEFGEKNKFFAKLNVNIRRNSSTDK